MPILHLTARDLMPVVTLLGAYRSELIAAYANIAAATQDTFRNPGAREALHYLRVLIPVTNEGRVDAPRRLPSNRHNAYLKPRGRFGSSSVASPRRARRGSGGARPTRTAAPRRSTRPAPRARAGPPPAGAPSPPPEASEGHPPPPRPPQTATTPTSSRAGSTG